MPQTQETTGGRTHALAVAGAFAAVYLGWGSTFLATRIAVESLPFFFIGAVRSLLAGAILYGYCSVWRGQRSRPGGWRAATVSGALLILVANGTLNFGEQTVPSGTASLIFALVPLFLLVLQSIRRRTFRLPRRTLASILLGFVGVLILLDPTLASGGAVSNETIRGNWLLLGGSLAWAVGSLYAVDHRAADSALLDVAMQLLAGGALMLLASGLRGEINQLTTFAPTLRSWLALAYLTFVGSLVAFTAYIWLLRHVPSEQVATYAYVNPAVAVLLGWLLGGETLNLRIALATAVIVASVALVVRRGSTFSL